MHPKDVIQSDKTHSEGGRARAAVGEHIWAAIVRAMDGVVKTVRSTRVTGVARGAALESTIRT